MSHVPEHRASGETITSTDLLALARALGLAGVVVPGDRWLDAWNAIARVTNQPARQAGHVLTAEEWNNAVDVARSMNE